MYGPIAAASEEIDFPNPNIFSGSLTIRSADAKGEGAFALKSFAEGKVVIVGKPVSRSPERTWQTVQLDIDTHVRMDLPFEFVNHSCNPNCGIKPNEFHGCDLVAMRDIEPGEEITFDYCMTEWIIIGFKKCSCNSDRCRKIIRGGKFLSPEELKAYDGYIAPYYQSLLQKS